MKKRYQIELANRIGRLNGRMTTVGNDYIITRRPDGYTTALAHFATREEAQEWIDQRIADDREDEIAKAANNFDDGGVS